MYFGYRRPRGTGIFILKGIPIPILLYAVVKTKKDVAISKCLCIKY